MPTEEFVDSTVFLGMHSRDDTVRSACASYFAAHANCRVAMSLEDVGRCDDVIWRFTRAEQDAYYPFMDRLHSDMDIVRLGYSDGDVSAALSDGRLRGLPIADRLTLGMVIHYGGMLRSLRPALLFRPDLPVRVVDPCHVRTGFPPVLEELYSVSLALRIPLGASGRKEK